MDPVLGEFVSLSPLRSGTMRGEVNERNRSLCRRPAHRRARGQHHAAVVNEIVQPMRGGDQRLGFRRALFLAGGSRELHAKEIIDLVLDV